MLIASASADKTARVWLASTGECLHSFAHNDSVSSVAFSHDSALIASASVSGAVQVRRVGTGEMIRNISAGGRVTFSHDSTLLASICPKHGFFEGWSQSLNNLQIWCVETGECVKTLKTGGYHIWSIAFSQDSKLVASLEDDVVRIWNTNSGICISTLECPPHDGFWPLSMAFSHDSTLIATGEADGTIKIWFTSTGDCIKTLDGYRRRVLSIAFSHDSALLASAGETCVGDLPIRIWQGSSGACIKTLEGHRGNVRALVFSSNSALIASASEDMTVRLWRVDTASV